MLVFGRSCKRFFFVAGKGFSFEKKRHEGKLFS